MDQAVLANKFMYHAPKEGQPEKYVEIRDMGKQMAELLNNMCPESQEKTEAIKNIEQAVFWANAAIARHEVPKKPWVTPEVIEASPEQVKEIKEKMNNEQA